MTNDCDSSQGISRRALIAASGLAAVGATAGAVVGQSRTVTRTGEDGGRTDESAQEVVVRQEPGNAFYWVLPGPRRLSPHVFGTPENPRFGTELLRSRIEEAKALPEPLGDAVPQLLEDLPVLVAAPDEGREMVDEEDATVQQVFAEPTLYSDEAEVTGGSFEITYRDRRPYDLRGPPGETPDAVDVDASFTDPAGNEYRIEFDHVVQPPIPGYQTGGGVMIDAWHHGTTGTGSPLMAKLYNYGATWGVGNLLVDGEVVDENKVMHFMTTQIVRNTRYNLAIDEELPLAPENTIAGQVHHTHGIVLPVTATPDGPVFEPVQTAFELPNGDTQPFIHAMWEQDEIVEGPFADWSWPGAGEESTPTEDGGDAEADYRLGGDARGWIGLEPSDIQDETNPALTLQADTEYVLVWENRDGIQHNFAIENADGVDVLATEFVGEEGATQTVTFAATAEMSEYYCQVHPSTMRGEIDVQS